MALGDSLLDAAMRTYQPITPAANTIEQADQINAEEQEQPLRQGILQSQLAQTQAETPLKIALEKAQTKNELFSNALQTSTDPASFDANMRSLADQGYPEAAQYIGRYSPVLQERLQGVYGGQPGGGAVGISGDTSGLDQPTAASGKGAGAAPSTSGLDYQFAQTTPQQRAQALQRLTALSQGLEQVNSPESWNAMRQKLDQMGIPLMDQLGDYSPIKAASVYAKVQPILGYLQNRSIADQSGVPQPKAAPDIRTVGNSIFSVDPYNGTATNIASAPKFAATSGQFGQPMVLNENTGQFSSGTPNDGVFGFDDFAKRMNGLENGTGNRSAQNPNSSATGNGQFTEGTWLQTVKAARPELAQNMTDAQLLQLRKDPAFSQEMTAQYAQANAGALQQNGQPVNATSLALAHRFGPQGAVSVLAASPDTKLSSILSADAIKANPQLANMTAGDYVQKLGGQVGMTPIGAGDNGGPGGANPDLHGADFLKTLPPSMAAQVQGLAEGRIPFPSGYSMSKLQPLIQAVSQYDPTFDAVNYQARNKTRSDFTSGQSAKTLTALNTALGHAAGLMDNFDNLGNTNFPAVNGVVNWAKTQFGNPNPTIAQENVESLASEARKVFAASGGGNLTELENWQKNFPINGSPAQQKGALQEFVSLLDSRMSALGDQYNKGMGVTQDPLNLLSANGRAAYTKLTGHQPESGSVPGQGGGNGAGRQLSAQDQQAIAWANANPRDPRAAQIKAKLGM